MANYQIVANSDIPSLSMEGGGRGLAIASDGRRWAVFSMTPPAGSKMHIHVAYSDDGGQTWTPEQVTGAINQDHHFPAIAIDSNDDIHIVYKSLGRDPLATKWGVFYNKRTTGVWGTEETVALLDVTSPGQDYPCIAIDSWDDVHVAWNGKGWGTYTAVEQILYRKRTSGDWGTTEQVTDINADQDTVSIAIGSDDSVRVAWNGRGWGVNSGNDQVIYAEGPTVWWSEAVTDNPANQVYVRLALDSSDKPHLVFYDASNDIIYYTNKTGVSWLSPEQVNQVGATVTYGYPSIAVDRSDGVHVIWVQYGQGLSEGWSNLWYRKRNGSWADPAYMTDQDTADQWGGSLLWAMWPEIGGVRTNILPTVQNAIWEAMGEADWFGISTTITAPAVTTDPATSVEEETATLHGTLDDDGGEACDVRFQYGLTDAYGTDTDWQAGFESIDTFLQAISGLSPNTTYHFRAQAKNSQGTSSGADRTFTTEVAVPTVTTDPATSVEEETATLHGTLGDDGGEACDVRFQYGLTDVYGTDTDWQAGFESIDTFLQAISGLSPGTLYHFRAQADNDGETGNGNDATFLTKPEAPTSLATNPAGAKKMDLKWVKGEGGTQTMIRRSSVTYPENRSDGELVYQGTAEYVRDTGLDTLKKYYYSAWAYASSDALEQWSDDKDTVAAIPTGGNINIDQLIYQHAERMMR